MSDESRASAGLAFGPVPSRRLGRSLGINNVPFKHCSFSCVYCQLGPTGHTTAIRRAFHSPGDIVDAADGRVRALRNRGERIDYLTIVPDGEPTLDLGLGELIAGLKTLGIPVAVISNGSLIDRDDVREELSRADWVSLKVDAADEATWRAVNRPDAALSLPSIHAGMRAFAERFEGTLVTETMLVAGLNDGLSTVRATAARVAELSPVTAYLNTPVRPTSGPSFRAPSAERLLEAAAAFQEIVSRVEVIPESADIELASTGDFEADVLGIAAVHPIRERELRTLVDKSEVSWAAVDSLLRDGRLRVMDHAGERFYVARGAAEARR